MRIRTDGDYSYRKDAIDEAADFYDRNKTDSIVRSCEDIPALVESILEVLEREDLTHKQRKELAETLSTRYIQFEIDLVEQDIQAEAIIE